ncbi:MAG TPA: hypothetical protein VIL48_11480 [Acidimicrobiales bacterium]
MRFFGAVVRSKRENVPPWRRAEVPTEEVRLPAGLIGPGRTAAGTRSRRSGSSASSACRSSGAGRSSGSPDPSGKPWRIGFIPVRHRRFLAHLAELGVTVDGA